MSSEWPNERERYARSIASVCIRATAVVCAAPILFVHDVEFASSLKPSLSAGETQMQLQTIRADLPLASTGRHVGSAYGSQEKRWAECPELTEVEGNALSDRQLQERREREITEALAQALGLTAQDLDRVDYMVDPQRGSDGTLHGYNIYFGDGADPEILGRIHGLVNGRWVRIGPVL